MPPMPEIDTAEIRARAKAAHAAVAALRSGEMRWRMPIPDQPDSADAVIPASLADVDVLLVALAHAAADENAIPTAQTGPMLEVAVATLRQVLAAFGQPEGGGSLSIRSNATRALVAQWRRALVALDAGESFHRGERPPTADVELLRRELGALVPLVEAAREVAAAMRFSATPAVARLIAAVAELDGTGTAPHSGAAALDPVTGTPGEGQPTDSDAALAQAAGYYGAGVVPQQPGRPGDYDWGVESRMRTAAETFSQQMAGVQAKIRVTPTDLAALRQAAIDAGNAVSVVPSTPGLMTPAEHRAMELTAELFNLMCREVIDHGPARQGDVSELAADIHRLQHRILRQAAGRAYPDRYRMLGGWPAGADHA